MIRYSPRVTPTPLTLPRKSSRAIAPFLGSAIALLIGLVGIGWTLSHPDNSLTVSHVYLIYQISDQNEAELATYINFDLSRNLPPGQYLNVDLLAGDTLNNLYSAPLEALSLQNLKRFLSVTPSTDVALIQAIHRMNNLLKSHEHQLEVVLITPGTQNPDTLNQIRQLATDLSHHTQLTRLRLYLVGLRPENKLAIAEALQPLRVSIAGSCTADYPQCRSLLEPMMR